MDFDIRWSLGCFINVKGVFFQRTSQHICSFSHFRVDRSLFFRTYRATHEPTQKPPSGLVGWIWISEAELRWEWCQSTHLSASFASVKWKFVDSCAGIKVEYGGIILTAFYPEYCHIEMRKSQISPIPSAPWLCERSEWRIDHCLCLSRTPPARQRRHKKCILILCDFDVHNSPDILVGPTFRAWSSLSGVEDSHLECFSIEF